MTNNKYMIGIVYVITKYIYAKRRRLNQKLFQNLNRPTVKFVKFLKEIGCGDLLSLTYTRAT